MKIIGRQLIGVMLVMGMFGCASGPCPAPMDRGALVPVYKAETVWNGITIADNGRAFVCFPHNDGGIGLRIAEISSDSTLTAYPDLNWNSYKTGDDPAAKFVGANALRIGPDGKLWVIDDGTTGAGTKVVPGAVKIVVIDIATNKVDRIISHCGRDQVGQFCRRHSVQRPARVPDRCGCSGDHRAGPGIG